MDVPLIYNIINMAPNSASPKMIATMTTASKSYTFNKCKQQSKSGVVKAKKPSGFTLFKPFGCGQCRMRFIQMEQLQKHVRFHNQEKKLTSLQAKSDETVQKTNSKTLKCCLPDCGKMFKTREALGSHIRRMHF